MKLRFCFLVLVVFGAATEFPAPVAKFADETDSRIVIQHHPKTLTTNIIIEAEKGCVSWSDILVGLARAKGFDDAAFADLLPKDNSLRLDDWTSGWAVLGWNQVLPKGIKLQLLAAPNAGQQPKLKITLDKKMLLASQRQLQKQFRDAVTKYLGPLYPGLAKEYGLKLDPGWDKAPLTKPLVVLVPGFQANLKFNEPFAAFLREQGFLVGDFRYPNDQSLDESAEQLAKALKVIAAKQPGRKIQIVGHSMGGLVVRRIIEDPDLDPGNVARLIMVCTPNHGSKLASFGFALEWWEHLVDNPPDNGLKIFFAAVEDGLCEAAEDLEPDSVFLNQLNARPLHAKVKYSLLLGNKGFISEATLKQLRAQAPNLKNFNRWTKFFGPRLDNLLAELDELVHEKGDGAVALCRGKLAGVADCVTLSIDHLAIAREPATPAEHQLRAEILKRLKFPVGK